MLYKDLSWHLMNFIDFFLKDFLKFHINNENQFKIHLQNCSISIISSYINEKNI